MTHPATDAPPPQEAVGPLMRSLSVLRALSTGGGRQAVGDLVRATGLARSTVDRVLSTLARLGYVRVEGRDAVLAPGLLELGNAYLAASELPDRLGPAAERLADALDESVSLAVPDGDGVRFVHQATRRRAMSLAFRIGDLLPAERGAPGALFAADWDADAWRRWRERRAADPTDAGFPAVPPRRDGNGGTGGPGNLGADFAARGENGSTRSADPGEDFASRVEAARTAGWSLDDQLIEPGLVAVAVPVRDPHGRPVCAVSVVSHTSRLAAADLPTAVLPRLRETVAEMERTLADPAPTAPAPEPTTGRHASWMRASKQELGPEFVESLARGLLTLTAFGTGRAELPLTAVAQATGLARATARRALITLEHLGYLASDGRLFRPTPKVLDLGFAALSGLTLPEIAQPHLATLVEQVHDSASMAVLSGTDIQYVARVPTVRIMSVNITVGTRFPAYPTSMGRVLLAGLSPAERTAHLSRTTLTPLTQHTVTSPERLATLLEQVGEDGYALVDEELEEGLRSLAVPVRDRDSRVVAAVNISTHAGRRSPAEDRDAFLPPLRAAAARIEADLRTAGRYVRIAVA
ncbi:IclR family transcriptional regulator [Streptomyces sp. NRRL F-5755]|uniref:IclR family transcriptional regulator domain-containing protein n=1 Tax=Streptomyces sp. NRRL F-5755 TaxID=1519475 RepID=UPI0006ADA563|nr:IclR family transcriptional regulator C-terminal domain-containing protein [Streptomyces sp. NRRL F-5755]KOT86745.1 IclR family transcriptional regulator [Streptomyces sp. NRRL F-5755]